MPKQYSQNADNGMTPAKPLQEGETTPVDVAAKTDELSEKVVELFQKFMALDKRLKPEIALQHAIDLVKSAHDSGEKQTDRDHQVTMQQDSHKGAVELAAMKPKPSSDK